MSLYKNRSFRARLGFALQGLVHGVRAERSLQVQLLALAAALAIAAELFNTALEGLADALHPHDHPGIRIAKNCAAAGVLIAALGALTVALALALHLLGR